MTESRVSSADKLGGELYWRLSSFYFFYFASIGALVPYWGLYLRSQGFGAVEIGQLLAVLMGTKVVAPNLWGWIADRSGRRMAVVRFGSLASLIFFAGFFFGHGYAWTMAVMFLFSFFWNATLPQFEAATFDHLGSRPQGYSMVRLWGSVGFILTVTGIGALLELYPAADLPKWVIALLLLIWLSSLFTPEAPAHALHDSHPPLGRVLRQRAVLALFVVCFLLQASHGPYYTFYSIYLENHGYGRGLIGQLWALGVIAEILVFLLMHKMMPRFGARKLLALALLLTAGRWLLIGYYVDNFVILLVAQGLHAASFGVYHAVAIHLIYKFFQGRLQGRGQALYSSVSFGAGGAFGALYSGYAWHELGATASYNLAAIMAAVAFLITLIWVRDPEVKRY